MKLRVNALTCASAVDTVFKRLGEPNPNEPFSHHPRVYWTLCFVFSLLLLLYVARGVWAFSTTPRADTDDRWQEVHTLMQGVSPNILNQQVKHYLQEHPGSIEADAIPPELRHLAIWGRAYAIGVYPSYTYVMSVPLVWPDTVAKARLWFFPTSILSLVLIATFIYTQYRNCLLEDNCLLEEQTRGVVLLPVATLCSSSVMDSIHRGNYTLIVTAALIAMFLSIQNYRKVQPGVWLAVAMIKPTIAVPFGLVLLDYRRFWFGIAACALVLLSCVWLAYVLTGTSPLASTMGALNQADYFIGKAGGLSARASLYEDANVGRNSAIIAILVCLTGLVALYVNRQKGLHLAFATAAVVSILCTYHRSYDHLILIFLLLYIGRNILIIKQAGASARVQSAVFFTIVSTIILPTSVIGGNDLNIYRETVWAICLVISISAAWERPMSVYRSDKGS